MSNFTLAQTPSPSPMQMAAKAMGDRLSLKLEQANTEQERDSAFEEWVKSASSGMKSFAARRALMEGTSTRRQEYLSDEYGA